MINHELTVVEFRLLSGRRLILLFCLLFHVFEIFHNKMLKKKQEKKEKDFI